MEEDAVGETLEVSRERFFFDNLLVRIHFIIVMIRWTGLAPWGVVNLVWSALPSRPPARGDAACLANPEVEGRAVLGLLSGNCSVKTGLGFRP